MPHAAPYRQSPVGIFPSKPKRRRAMKGKQAREGFEPTEQQELTAVNRLEGKLKKCARATYHSDVLLVEHDGNVWLAQEEALWRMAKQLVPSIHSRGNELGRGRWELETTLYCALQRGIEDGKFELVIFEGEVVIKLRHWRIARQHRFANRPSRRAVSVA